MKKGKDINKRLRQLREMSLYGVKDKWRYKSAYIPTPQQRAAFDVMDAFNKLGIDYDPNPIKKANGKSFERSEIWGKALDQVATCWAQICKSNKAH